MIKRVLFLIAGIVLVIWVMSAFGIQEIISTISSLNIYLFFIAIGFQLSVFSLLSIKLQLVCEEYKHLDFKDAFKIVITGLTINFITPLMKVGGEPAKIYLLKKKGRSTGRSSAIVMIDSTVELVSIYLLTFLGFLAMVFTGKVQGLFLIGLGAGIILAFGLIGGMFSVLINEKWLEKIIKFGIKIAKKFKKDLKTRSAMSYAKKFNKAFHFLLKNKRQMTKLFGVSIFSKLIEFIRIWIIFLALGTIVPLQVILFAWSVIMILSLIPWLPGNLGVVEAGGASAFVLFGIASGISASAILVDRLLSFWFVLFLGLPILGTLKTKKVKDIAKGEEK